MPVSLSPPTNVSSGNLNEKLTKVKVRANFVKLIVVGGSGSTVSILSDSSVKPPLKVTNSTHEKIGFLSAQG